ncbi:MAG: PEGA domain-containing protein [Deltaproteobacteria bacterium]|nr:PEGA domain-containing protein [Deltaproteobacteria bacterium]
MSFRVRGWSWVALLGCLGARGLHAAEPPPAPAPVIEKVLVLELVSAGVDPSLAKNLSEVLAQAIRTALPQAAVLAQSDMKSMLELERQRDLLGCTEDVSCLAEIGGALGADHLIVGSVGSVGKLYVLSIKLLDAAHARTERQVSADVAAQEHLLEATRQWGTNLVSPAAPAGVGYLDVRGDGVVSVDGKAVGAAPVDRIRIAAGFHVVALGGPPATRARERRVEAAPYETIRVDFGSDEAERAGDPVRTAARLEVESDPPGANVRLDGVAVGATPVAVAAVAPSVTHTVAVVLDGFDDQELEVTLSPGQTRALRVALTARRPAAWLLLQVGFAYFQPGMFSGGHDLGVTVVDATGTARAADTFALKQAAAGFIVTAAAVFARHHEIAASFTRADITLKTDEREYASTTAGSGSLLRGVIGYHYVASLPIFVRPYAGLMLGVQRETIAESALDVPTTAIGLYWQGPTRHADNFALDVTAGARAELPLQMLIDLSWRFNLAALKAGLLINCVTFSVGAYL